MQIIIISDISNINQVSLSVSPLFPYDEFFSLLFMTQLSAFQLLRFCFHYLLILSNSIYLILFRNLHFNVVLERSIDLVFIQSTNFIQKFRLTFT